MGRVRRVVAVGLAVATAAVLAVPIASADPGVRCDRPGQRVPAAAVDVDQNRLTAALDYGMGTGAGLVQVYRYGCLIGERSVVGDRSLPVFSASKSVAALVVGRAVTMGYFDVDDRLGKFFPEADAAHRALTVRDVLTQTTGIRFNVAADAVGSATDGVATALDTPVVSRPGAVFHYAQAPLSLLAEIVRRSTGQGFTTFAAWELFGELGIASSSWSWRSDASGTPMISGGLSIRPADLARFGRLLHHRGMVGGRQLITPAYLDAAIRGSAANPGYGYTFWTNTGNWHVNTAGERVNHPVWSGSPRDTYAMSGAFGQFLVVMPRLGFTIVRVGVPTDASALEKPASILAGSSNPQFKALFRQVAATATGH